MCMVIWHLESSLATYRLPYSISALRQQEDIDRLIYTFLPTGTVLYDYFDYIRIYIYGPLAPPWGLLNLYGTGLVVHSGIIEVYWDYTNGWFRIRYRGLFEGLWEGLYDEDEDVYDVYIL